MSAILVLNSGSSSLKFGLFAEQNGEETALVSGRVEEIGRASGLLVVSDASGREVVHESRVFAAQDAALTEVQAQLKALAAPEPAAIAHRMVHGGPKLTAHCRITPQVEQVLADDVHFAPLHIPVALQLVRHTELLYPALPQFACFDTAFHQTMPEEAYRYALPARYFARGVRRYGFHGLSCASIVHALGAQIPERLVIAHLGSGASITAIHAGQSVDTSMGMTPTGGIPMGTRTGDLDPGVALFLMRDQSVDADGLEHLLNHESGIEALGGVADTRILDQRAASGNHDAALALNVFTRAIAKTIAGYAAVLGGLDAIVFAGGIGEHSASVRASVCGQLAFLGVELDAERNEAGAHRLSAETSRVLVRVVPSEEEAQMAREVRQLL